MRYLLAVIAFYFAGHCLYAAYDKGLPIFYAMGMFAVGLGVASLFIRRGKK